MLAPAGPNADPNDLDRREAREIVRRLEAMERAGQLVCVPGRGWVLPEHTPFRIGVQKVDRRGNGIVITRGRGEGPIFVPAAERQDAVAGDTVLVRRVSPPRKSNLAEGHVVRVIERRRQPLRGTLRRHRRGGVVFADDWRQVEQIFIPHLAKDIADDGDPVLVRLLPGSKDGKPEGEVVVNLRDEGTLETDLDAIRAEFGLPEPRHDPEVEAAAAACPAIHEGLSWPDRRDLRGLLTITIDPTDAKDFDDAVSLELRENGSLRLGVHIADVSSFVQPDSILDAAARARGTSVYLPGQVLPMLPERLANDLCSLRPGEDRLAMSVLITFDAGGRRRRTEIARSVIRSNRRFTYAEVQAILDRARGESSGMEPPADHELYRDVLLAMDGLRARLHIARRSRGALMLDIPKLRLELDERGEVTGLGRESRDSAHELIEEFMLVANESVARYFDERGLPIVRRVHPEPEEDRLMQFREFVEILGFDWPGRATSGDLERLVDQVRESPLGPVVQLAMLRALGHAEYVGHEDIHFALATGQYCHFTSPIRRYPDLVVHQILAEHLAGELRGRRRIDWWTARIEEVAPRCSEQEKRAEAAERAMIQLRLVRFLEPRIGEELEGTITSVHGFGFFVRIDPDLLEGLVHVSSLGDDFFDFDEETLSLVGVRSGRTFRAGDRVSVVLAELDPENREIGFRLVGVDRPDENDKPRGGSRGRGRRSKRR